MLGKMDMVYCYLGDILLGIGIAEGDLLQGGGEEDELLMAFLHATGRGGAPNLLAVIRDLKIHNLYLF